MKIITTISLTGCLLAVATTGTAQHVAMPLLSFVADESHNLHPLIGIAGSASVGGKLNLGFEVLETAVGPQQDYVVVTMGDDHRAMFIELRGGGLSVQSLNAVNCDSDQEIILRKGKASNCTPQPLAGIDRIALSPTGSAAALFNGTVGLIYAFDNLSHSPTLAAQFDVRSLGNVTAIGISDNGQTVAVAVSDGAAGSVFVLSTSAGPQRVGAMRHPAAIHFFHSSEAAIIADDFENTIYGLSDGHISALATAKEGVSKPVGIAVSTDNQKIFVANFDSASVLTIPLDGSSIVSTDCHCTLTGLYSTRSDAVFRATNLSGGPLVLFDGAADTPRLMFAPINPQ